MSWGCCVIEYDIIVTLFGMDHVYVHCFFILIFNGSKNKVN